MVADGTIGLHHVEFHTTQPQDLISLFIHTYGFALSAMKTTSDYCQWLLDSHQCRLIISSVSSKKAQVKNNVNKDQYDILTTLLADEKTRRLVVDRKTVFNLALTVKCVQSVLDRNPNVLVSRRQAVDEHGSIEYACIKSSLGNVVHTIIDMSNYSGPYLPGFTPVTAPSHQQQQYQPNEGIISSIDHVAFAVPRELAHETMTWYERVLGLTRFVINREDDPFQGFAVNVGSMGMRMFSGIYWKCAETGCADSTKKLKFVFVESLINDDSNATDQITTFITNHNDQGGIQHIALISTNTIKDAVRTIKANGAEFLTPCLDYYSQENNGKVIEAAGESAAELRELGILLDDEADGGDTQGDISIVTKTKRVLLQIFTTSLFENNTFFLELIERRGANGFGSGNVRTLWKIVQKQMDRDT